MININELAKRSHELALAKGWWDGVQRGNVDSILAKIALIHSELSEAWAEARGGVGARWYHLDGDKPNGFIVELADAVIRAADLIGWLGGCGDRDEPVEFIRDDNVAGDLEDLRYSLDQATEFFRVGDEWNALLLLVVVIRGIEVLAEHGYQHYSEAAPDLAAAIELKHAYSMTRPRRHGGKLA